MCYVTKCVNAGVIQMRDCEVENDMCILLFIDACTCPRFRDEYLDPWYSEVP